jgi:hypothetical protein
MMRLGYYVLLLSGTAGLISCARPQDTDAVASMPAVRITSTDIQAAAPQDMVEDLTYKQWQAFPKGTVVVRRTTTQNSRAPRPTISYTTIRLLERTDDHIVLEQQTRTERSTGDRIENEPMTFRYHRQIPLPPNVRREDWGKPRGIREQGTETVEVLGQSYRCTYMKYTSDTEAGEMLSTIWVCSDMPGGLVKSHSYVPNADETTIIEIVDLQIPKQ